jgi:hypothetical protein
MIVKIATQDIKTQYVGRRLAVLLDELAEACNQTLKVLARLEMHGLDEKQVDELLGELSSQVVHLHAHTRGLSAIIDKNVRA